MPRMQIDLEHLFLLVGQVLGHLGLGPAQHHRADPVPQSGEPIGMLPAFDRSLVELAEPGRVGEHPGRGERQHGPQIHQAVLQRRPGHGDGEVNAHPADGRVGLGLMVLHELGLIQDQSGPGHRPVGLVIQPEQGVRGDHDVSAGDIFRERASPLPFGLLHLDDP
jgi:hypothetical protein